ncbi:resolvase [Vibrio inusitatus NBRC 102082]|uniref:Resolvase n=1 Tax=Vibrio inusitatus NBRC 102082 TaxID=1219070 RepID=A0A4Y3HQG9_9VIBR|nr:recombinase family protein [Vibrio inusitatus]GEA49277.1 resolvase [Vibrio inusitatus NBRC 102082]
MANIAYKRVSSSDQKTDRQLDGMTFDKVFEEHCSAKTISRPVWDECLNYLREGDSLTIHSLDRVCRSGAGDAVAIVERLSEKGVSIEFIKEGLKFNGVMTAAQKGVLGILASIAQMERELIRERQREGIEVARSKGKTLGRPKKTVNIELIHEMKRQGKSATEIAKELKIGRATYYRYIKE